MTTNRLIDGWSTTDKQSLDDFEAKAQHARRHAAPSLRRESLVIFAFSSFDCKILMTLPLILEVKSEERRVAESYY